MAIELRSGRADRGGVQLFCSDLDGTLLGHPEGAQRFKRAWESLPTERRPLLVYNSGRTVDDTRWLVLAGQLPVPQFIIGGVGTEVHDPLDARVTDEFSALIDAAWDYAVVDRTAGATPGIRRQPVEFISRHKSSWHWHHATSTAVRDLRLQLVAAGVEASVIYSCKCFLDIIPARAGKGNALAWLCQRIGVPLERVVVAGDTGNDNTLFTLPGVRGILVGNALPELRQAAHACRPYSAQAEIADGVIEGLRQFGVFADSADLMAPDNIAPAQR